MRTASRLGLAALLASALGCATARLPSAGGGQVFVSAELTKAVIFDHGCPQERIVVLRRDAGTQVDLDVCGKVRRYKAFGGSAETLGTWLDVTALYPPESLPAPREARPAAAPAP